MPERAAFARTMAPDFRVGAGVGGDLGAMSYAAAVMSSSRWIDGDLFDRGAMVAVRLAAEPIGPVGLTPWRRPLDDPWTDWVRFGHGVSFLYGTLFEPRSIGAGTDAAIQWRRVVVTGEYLFLHAPSGDQQGAVRRAGRHAGAAPPRHRRARQLAARRGRERVGRRRRADALRERSPRPLAGRLRAPHRPRPSRGGQLRAVAPDLHDRLGASRHRAKPRRGYVGRVTAEVAKRRAETVLVIAATLLIAAVVWPLWRPLLIAAVLAGVLSPLYEKVVARLGGRRSLVAGLFTAATVVLILIPLGVLATIAIRQAVEATTVVRDTIASEGVGGLIAKAPDSIEGWLHRFEKQLPTEIDKARTQFAAGGRWALGAVSGALAVLGRFGFKLAMMLIAFFFLLRDGRALIGWLGHATPLPPDRVRQLMREFRTTARSVLGANFITGAVQAVIATIGFFIAGAPSPIFFGLITLFASLIPSVGTALVTLPVAGLVLLLGHPWKALFLALWALVVVGLIDNILRPVLIRGGVQLHGALVFFSLLGALGAFGAVGLFLGPLALVFFLATVRTTRAARETAA